MITLLTLLLACGGSGPDCEAAHEGGGLYLEYSVRGGGPDEVLGALRARLDAMESPCGRVSRRGERVVVEIPGADAEDGTQDLLARQGSLHIRPVLPRARTLEILGDMVLVGPADPGVQVDEHGPWAEGLAATERVSYWLRARRSALPAGVTTVLERQRGEEGRARIWLVGGEGLLQPQVEVAEAVRQEGRVSLQVRLSQADGERFATLTSAHVGEVLVIDLDGEVLAAPVVREAIGGGAFTVDPGPGHEDAEAWCADLATTLRAGSLPHPLSLEIVRAYP